MPEGCFDLARTLYCEGYRLMGSARRHSPENLASKLRMIRDYLELSQRQIAARLMSKIEDERIEVDQSDISAFERGTREPPLAVLLAYVRITPSSSRRDEVTIETLVDDKERLPFELGVWLQQELAKSDEQLEAENQDKLARYRRYGWIK